MWVSDAKGFAVPCCLCAFTLSPIVLRSAIFSQHSEGLYLGWDAYYSVAFWFRDCFTPVNTNHNLWQAFHRQGILGGYALMGASKSAISVLFPAVFVDFD